MLLGISSHADAESGAAFFSEAAHCGDEFVGVAVSSGLGRETLLAQEAVATKGQDILDP